MLERGTTSHVCWIHPLREFLSSGNLDERPESMEGTDTKRNATLDLNRRTLDVSSCTNTQHMSDDAEVIGDECAFGLRCTWSALHCS